MDTLNFPPYSFKIRPSDNGQEIWDDIRKKWVVLTPEEWVRVHLVQFLIQEKKYPAGRVSVEKLLEVHGQKRRYDIVVAGKNGEPVLLAECKAPGVKITQHVFDQIAHYNIVLRVPLLIVSNGIEHYCCRVESEQIVFLADIPLYVGFV